MNTMELPVIKNLNELSTSPLRADALAIVEAGYESVLTERVIRENVTLDGDTICVKDKNICFSDYERIFFVGIGKCAVDASQVFEELLGDRIADGVVLDVKSGVFKKIRSEVGTHPFPSEKNVSVTQSIVKMLESATERDLVFTVVSGGGSSLLCLPHDMGCETLRRMTEALFKAGATIQEINTVRKHTSDIQGGQFAEFAFPSHVVSFIFSDVPGDDLSMIASGPTVLDTTTRADAEAILQKYNVLDICELPECELVETPKDEKFFQRVSNILLVTNKTALAAMSEKAIELGYRVEVESSEMQGEARVLGRELVQRAGDGPLCMLNGGETTVKIEGGGKGGRNQEFVLGALPHLDTHTVVVAVASDGWDNTDMAGAIADRGLYERSKELGVFVEDALRANDSYGFFDTLGGHIKTGRTGINVADLYMLLKK